MYLHLLLTIERKVAYISLVIALMQGHTKICSMVLYRITWDMSTEISETGTLFILIRCSSLFSVGVSATRLPFFYIYFIFYILCLLFFYFQAWCGSFTHRVFKGRAATYLHVGTRGA